MTDKDCKHADTPTVATYLWCDHSPFPDAIVLKDSSALLPEGRSRRVESYGRNAHHYARETEYASLVTDMYVWALRGHDTSELEGFAKRMKALGLEVPE